MWKVVAVLASLILAQSASAQDAGILDEVLRTFEEQSVRWYEVLIEYALGLFWILVLLELVIASFTWVTRDQDIKSIIPDMVKFVLFVGLGSMLLNNAAELSSIFLQSFEIAGISAGFGPGFGADDQIISPSNLLAIGVNIATTLFEAAFDGGVSNIGSGIMVFLLGIVLVVTYAIMAGLFFLVQVEVMVIIAGGCFLLGFWPLRFTHPWATKFLGYALGAGVKLLFMTLLIGTAFRFGTEWHVLFWERSLDIRNGVGLAEGMEGLATSAIVITGASIVLLMLIWSVPTMAQQLLSGSPEGAFGRMGSNAIAQSIISAANKAGEQISNAFANVNSALAADSNSAAAAGGAAGGAFSSAAQTEGSSTASGLGLSQSAPSFGGNSLSGAGSASGGGSSVEPWGDSGDDAAASQGSDGDGDAGAGGGDDQAGEGSGAGGAAGSGTGTSSGGRNRNRELFDMTAGWHQSGGQSGGGSSGGSSAGAAGEHGSAPPAPSGGGELGLGTDGGGTSASGSSSSGSSSGDAGNSGESGQQAGGDSAPAPSVGGSSPTGSGDSGGGNAFPGTPPAPAGTGGRSSPPPSSAINDPDSSSDTGIGSGYQDSPAPPPSSTPSGNTASGREPPPSGGASSRPRRHRNYVPPPPIPPRNR